MASTYAELFSDFQDSVKIYTEKLDITEPQFMRLLSRGMQQFQRDTEYIEASARITEDASGAWIIPTGLIRLIEVKDKDYYSILIQNPEQFIRNQEKWQDGHLETPTDWQMRKQEYLRNNDNVDTYPRYESIEDYGYELGRMCTVMYRELKIYPELDTDTYFDLYYIPDLEAYSSNSTQWANWFPEDTNFYTQFTTSSIFPTLQMWENTFVTYAVSEYIKRRGSRNYQVFEAQYKSDVKEAILAKPQYMREMVKDYMLSPWS